MPNKPLFAGRDLQLIQSLVYDPTLEPAYEILKGCLTWSDERPDGVTPPAYETICDLWIARSLFHRDLDFADDPFDPEHFRSVWEQASKEIPTWPGFKRLKLSERDKAYYDRVRKEARECSEY